MVSKFFLYVCLLHRRCPFFCPFIVFLTVNVSALISHSPPQLSCCLIFAFVSFTLITCFSTSCMLLYLCQQQEIYPIPLLHALYVGSLQIHSFLTLIILPSPIIAQFSHFQHISLPFRIIILMLCDVMRFFTLFLVITCFIFFHLCQPVWVLTIILQLDSSSILCLRIHSLFLLLLQHK